MAGSAHGEVGDDLDTDSSQWNVFISRLEATLGVQWLQAFLGGGELLSRKNTSWVDTLQPAGRLSQSERALWKPKSMIREHLGISQNYRLWWTGSLFSFLAGGGVYMLSFRA